MFPQFDPAVDRSEARHLRLRCRRGEHTGPTCGAALGFAQANLVMLPKSLAFDFLLFCQRNPRPCPLLEVIEPGIAEPKQFAPGSDLRTDLPRYRVYSRGELIDEPVDVAGVWREDDVSFLLGCSFTFESALLKAGLRVRHLEERHPDGSLKNVPMYRTNIACQPAGIFAGPMVVSMRPFKPRDARIASQITSRYPMVHGAPIQIGDPVSIGIRDLSRPDWGDPVTILPDEVPVFWACGVTPQAVIIACKPKRVITHAPGHMFVTDVLDEELAS
jgi:uncharacterized protein YcsI (UPF0317 family)